MKNKVVYVFFDRHIRTLALALGLQALAPSFAQAAPRKPAGEPVHDQGMSYFVMDAQTGQPVEGLQQNADTPGLIASTTKIMTAGAAFSMVHAHLLSYRTKFTVSYNAAHQEADGSSMGLKEHDVVSVDDLLRGLMVASGNDAAVVLAEGMGRILRERARENLPALAPGQAADPLTDFMSYMNGLALGTHLKKTHFENPNGLKDVNASTAREMALLLAELIRTYPRECKEYFGREAFSYGSNPNDHGKPYKFNNHFDVLGEAGIDIVKSGFTHAAGRCGVFSAEQGGRRIVGVILHAPSGPYGRWNSYRNAEAVWLAQSALSR